MRLGYKRQWKKCSFIERTAGWQRVKWLGMQKYFQWQQRECSICYPQTTWWSRLLRALRQCFAGSRPPSFLHHEFVTIDNPGMGHDFFLYFFLQFSFLLYHRSQWLDFISLWSTWILRPFSSLVLYFVSSDVKLTMDNFSNQFLMH